MKRRQLVRSTVLIGLGLLLISCGESKNPLSDPLKAKPDERLAGIWRGTEDPNGTEYIHVGRAGGKLPSGILRSVSAAHNKDGTVGRPSEMLVFSTIIGENHYLNVILPKNENVDLAQLESGWKPDRVKGYCLVKYQVQGDSLNVWIMDPDAERHAIEAGKIKGNIDKNSVSLTDTSENLVALLNGPDGAKLFPASKPTMHYQRVK